MRYLELIQNFTKNEKIAMFYDEQGVIDKGVSLIFTSKNDVLE